MEWLEHVTKYHHEWIAIMKSFGAKDHAEDFVQEVYIRLLKGADLNNLFVNGNVVKGKINKAYVYFALRNTWIMHIRKQRSNRENKNRIEIVNYNHYDNDPSYKIDNLFSNRNELDHQINDQEKIKFNKYELILEKIDKEINSWHWYDMMMFRLYIDSGKSIRTLAKETNISRDSIFQTLKNCKTRIKIAIGEDWEDFRNKDYDLIKAE